MTETMTNPSTLVSVTIPMNSPPAAPETSEEPSSVQEVPPASLELGQAPVADRPAWLDPKFKSPEDLAKAYQELQAHLGSKAPEKPDASAAAQQTAKAAGITQAELEAYSREVTAQGKLSDASYSALEARGLPKALVDSHVAGLQALRQGVMDRALKAAGGADGYKQVAEWAATNLTPEAQAAYNADVNSGNADRVNYAVEGLVARHAAATSSPTRLHGRNPTGSPGFTSRNQQIAAQSDPRYQSDPAFRDEVLRMIREGTYD